LPTVIGRWALRIEPRTLTNSVPEGDTIHYAANRIRPLLAGHVPDEIATPHPRFAAARWPERLAGRAVTAVDAHGKHLFLRFEGDLTIHSHLRMTGSWRVLDAPRPRPRAAWLALRRGAHDVVQLNGPVLELMTESRTRFDQRLASLGPDILAPEFDVERFLRRLRDDDPTRAIGDALLDQRTIAGIGNLWKVEGCFAARIDPWRRTGDVTDDEALAIVGETRPRMRASALDGIQDRWRQIYGRAGQPCPRCGGESRIRSRGQGDGNRITYWCASCQR
jgi:endonuclease-8